MWLDSWTFSLFNQKKKKNDLQIIIFKKAHNFFVFLRKMKDKKLFNIIVATVGVA